jgi:hypothetical protein
MGDLLAGNGPAKEDVSYCTWADGFQNLGKTPTRTIPMPVTTAAISNEPVPDCATGETSALAPTRITTPPIAMTDAR